MCLSWYMMWQLMLYYKRRSAANLAPLQLLMVKRLSFKSRWR